MTPRTTKTARKTVPAARGKALPKRRPNAVESGILQGLREAVAFTRGELKLRVTARTATAAAAPDYTPGAIKTLRDRLKLSQPVFAEALNVSPETLRCWEQGKRRPDGTAMRLLQLTEQHPEWVLDAVQVR